MSGSDLFLHIQYYDVNHDNRFKHSQKFFHFHKMVLANRNSIITDICTVEGCNYLCVSISETFNDIFAKLIFTWISLQALAEDIKCNFISLTKKTLEFHFNGQILTLLLEKRTTVFNLLRYFFSRPNSMLSFKKLRITLLCKSEL